VAFPVFGMTAVVRQNSKCHASGRLKRWNCELVGLLIQIWAEPRSAWRRFVWTEWDWTRDSPRTRKRFTAVRFRRLLRSGGVARRVAATRRSCSRSAAPTPQLDLQACPSSVRDECGLRGNSGHTPSATVSGAAGSERSRDRAAPDALCLVITQNAPSKVHGRKRWSQLRPRQRSLTWFG
jgi:hypothetical protein